MVGGVALLWGAWPFEDAHLGSDPLQRHTDTLHVCPTRSVIIWPQHHPAVPQHLQGLWARRAFRSGDCSERLRVDPRQGVPRLLALHQDYGCALRPLLDPLGAVEGQSWELATLKAPFAHTGQPPEAILAAVPVEADVDGLQLALR